MSPRRDIPEPSSPLVRAPLSVGELNLAALLQEVVRLHREGGDPYLERMPEPTADGALGVLRHAEAHGHRLVPAQRRAAALARVRAWQYLGEQLPARQSAAVQDAREGGVEWAELAEPLAVNVPSAAYNKARRLRAAALGTDADGRPLRKTPEALAAAEAGFAAAERTEVRRREVAVRAHQATRARALELLARAEGLPRDAEGWVAYWLEEIQELLDDSDGGTEVRQTALAAAVSGLERELAKAP